MVDINPGDVVKAQCYFASPADTRKSYNTYFARYAGGSPLPEADAVADWTSYLTAMWNAYKANISNQIRFRRYTLYFVNRLENLPTVTVESVASDTSDQLPIPMSVQVLIRTGNRRVVGRKYLAGWGETYQNAGALTGTAITNMNTYLTKLDDEFPVGSPRWQPGIWSERYATFYPLVAAVYSVILVALSRRRQ